MTPLYHDAPLELQSEDAMRKDVPAVFNKLTGNDVVWLRSERMWRKREPHDIPGRQQP